MIRVRANKIKVKRLAYERSFSILTSQIAAQGFTATNVATLSVDCTGADFLYIFLMWSDPSDKTFSDCTYAGAATTNGFTRNFDATTEMRAHYIVAPASGSNNVVATITGTGDADEFVVIAIPMAGVNQSNPVDAAEVTAVSAGTSQSVTVTTGAVGDIILGFCGAGEPLTPQSGNELADLENIGGFVSANALSKDGSASALFEWTSAISTTWAAAAQPINPA